MHSPLLPLTEASIRKRLWDSRQATGETDEHTAARHLRDLWSKSKTTKKRGEKNCTNRSELAKDGREIASSVDDTFLSRKRKMRKTKNEHQKHFHHQKHWHKRHCSNRPCWLEADRRLLRSLAAWSEHWTRAEWGFPNYIHWWSGRLK